MEITQEQFEAYEEVRESGETNMFDVRAVFALAEAYCDVVLTREEVLLIMNSSSELQEKYAYS